MSKEQLKEEAIKEFSNTFIDWNSPRHLVDHKTCNDVVSFINFQIDKAYEEGKEEGINNLFKRLKENVIRYITWHLTMIGEKLVKTNAESMKQSCDITIEGKRYTVTANYKIKQLNPESLTK